MEKKINIAIDGPSGAGKSTISKMIAKELGILYVDTGALYRAIGLSIKNKGIAKDDEKNILPELAKIKVELFYKDGEQRVFLNGDDVSEKIRTPEISMYASAVSAIPAVRTFLLELQKKIARENSVIMDGRDIGTVILPGADVKIFLTASVEDRAMRRYKELVAWGEDVRYEEVLLDMKKRDENDASRAAAPLKQADDALLLDTTGNDLYTSVEILKKIILERMKSL